MCTSVTSTRSEVKVKVTELPKLRKVHFSTSISSAILAWSSKLMVGGHRTGPAYRSQSFEFPSRKAITRVRTSSSIDIWRNSNGHISVVRDTTVTWLSVLVVLHVLCMLTWPWPDPRSRSWSRSIWTTIAHNCTFLGLSPPPLSRVAQNWWLVVIVWTWSTACRSPIFEFPPTRATVSREFKLRRMSIFHDIQMTIFRYCVMLQSRGWGRR